MTATYHYGRFYARSEKHLTEMLDRIAYKGNWAKTKQMIDNHCGWSVDGRDPVPTFPQVLDHHGYGMATQVYRGVVFENAEAASRVRLFVNSVDNQQPEDMVLVRSWSMATVTDQVRRYGLMPSGLPWEPKGFNKARLEEMEEQEYQRRFKASKTLSELPR